MLRRFDAIAIFRRSEDELEIKELLTVFLISGKERRFGV